VTSVCKELILAQTFNCST